MSASTSSGNGAARPSTALRGPQDGVSGNASHDERLANAIGRFTRVGMARFDTRAAIATVLTLALVWLAVGGREIPRELALAYATILGWYFPRPAETGTARG